MSQSDKARQFDERWLRPHSVVPVDASTTLALITEIQRLRAARSSCADIMRDAERYRWLQWRAAQEPGWLPCSNLDAVCDSGVAEGEHRAAVPESTPTPEFKTINGVKEPFVVAAPSEGPTPCDCPQEGRCLGMLSKGQVCAVSAIPATDTPRTDEILADLYGGGSPLTTPKITMIEHARRLERENFALAAGQCLHGIRGDEGGAPYCPRIVELERAARSSTAPALSEAQLACRAADIEKLRQFVLRHTSYPDNAMIAHSCEEDALRMGTLRGLDIALSAITPAAK